MVTEPFSLWLSQRGAVRGPISRDITGEDLSRPLLPPRGLSDSGVTSHSSCQCEANHHHVIVQIEIMGQNWQFNNMFFYIYSVKADAFDHWSLNQHFSAHLKNKLVCDKMWLMHFSTPSIKATWVRQKAWRLQTDRVSKLSARREILALPLHLSLHLQFSQKSTDTIAPLLNLHYSPR